MSSKIKVLFCPSDRSGVGHFRSIWPAQHLKRFYSSEVDVHIDASPNVDDINELAKYDIIHFHRMLGPYEESERLFGELKKRGVTLVMDIDDYWMPPPTHHLYPIIVSSKPPAEPSTSCPDTAPKAWNSILSIILTVKTFAPEDKSKTSTT